MSLLGDVWDHLPFHGWIYLGIVLAALAAKTWYDHNQQVIGENKCLLAQREKQDKIDELQAALDAKVAKETKPLHDQYDALGAKTYEPINLAANCRPSDNVLHDINQAHARKPVR